MAPLLNSFINNAMDKRRQISVLAILVFVNVYLGFLGHRYGINEDGYNIMQFIFMYIIGRILCINSTTEHVCGKWKYLFLTIYFISSITWSFFALTVHKSIFNPFCYNNPFVIIGAISFFVFMASFKFSSNLINYFAASTLGVYLIQECPYMVQKFYPLCHSFYIKCNSSTSYAFISIIVASLAFTLICLIFDQIRVLFAKIMMRTYDLSIQSSKFLTKLSAYTNNL